jgi:hypothetical protein
VAITDPVLTEEHHGRPNEEAWTMRPGQGDADEADMLEQRSTETGIEGAASDDLTGSLVVADQVDEADALDQQRVAEPQDP